MISRENRCLLFFVKFPEAGRVKTRLAASLGEEITVTLYRNFILDILATIKTLAIPYHVCVYPAQSVDKFKQWLGDEISFFSQTGESLGEKLANAFKRCLKNGYKRIIVIGSDSPDLPAQIITDAFSALENNDAVIGPADDGGYYLIGFNRDTFLAGFFEGISWSTEKVFAETRAKFEKNNYRYQVLPCWQDVDTIDDLINLANRNTNTDLKDSNTLRFLSNCRI